MDSCSNLNDELLEFDRSFEDAGMFDLLPVKPIIVSKHKNKIISRKSKSSCENRRNSSKFNKRKCSYFSGKMNSNNITKPESRNSTAFTKTSQEFKPKMMGIRPNVISFRYCKSKDSIKDGNKNNYSNPAHLNSSYVHKLKQNNTI